MALVALGRLRAGRGDPGVDDIGRGQSSLVMNTLYGSST
jgi:hypothetical protein